jgi:hypothetical protein
VYNTFFGLGVSNARKKNTRRFVARVLGDELALEGALQDCLPQPLAALQVGLGDRFQFVDDRETALDLGDHGVLFDNWRKWNRRRSQV